MSNRATVEDMEALHALTCRVLLRAVQEMDASGKLNASLLQAASTFLRNAGVVAPLPSEEAVQDLLDAMPDFGDT